MGVRIQQPDSHSLWCHAAHWRYPANREKNEITGEETCVRNIKTLHNFAPPATADEIQAASRQFVRKLSGSTRPSKANEAAFERAVVDIATVVQELLDSLTTSVPPRNREIEAAKAHARAAQRFGSGRSPDAA